MLDEITVKDIKKKFVKPEFWDFIFETAYGMTDSEALNKAADKHYIKTFDTVMNTNVDGLIDYINIHIRHKVLITRKGINDFVLYMIDAMNNDVELTEMKDVRFQMIVSYLYDLVFESTWQYFR
jgi:hypothetical protein